MFLNAPMPPRALLPISHSPETRVREKGHVPLQRAGMDEEMAQGVLFLAWDTYVNGETVCIDEGALLDVPAR